MMVPSKTEKSWEYKMMREDDRALASELAEGWEPFAVSTVEAYISFDMKGIRTFLHLKRSQTRWVDDGARRL